MSTHNIPFSIERRKINLNDPKSTTVGFFQGTQEQARETAAGPRSAISRAPDS